MSNGTYKKLGRSRVGGDGWGKLSTGARRRANRAVRRELARELRREYDA